ncbi:MAG: hypothetical protein Q9180_007442, partial [Flavoplaca navasiana]
TRADYPADLGTRSSIKEKRVAAGRPAVVQDLRGAFHYVILNAIFELHGDDACCVSEDWPHRHGGAQIKATDTISLGRVALYANAIPKVRMLKGEEAVHEGYWPIPAQVESSFNDDLKKRVNIIGNGLHLTSTRCPGGEPQVVEDLRETTLQTTKKRERALDEADPPSEELQGDVPADKKKQKTAPVPKPTPKVSKPTSASKPTPASTPTPTQSQTSKPTPVGKPTPTQSQTSSPAPRVSKSTPTPKARKPAPVELQTPNPTLGFNPLEERVDWSSSAFTPINKAPNPTLESSSQEERFNMGSLAFTPVNKPTLPDLQTSTSPIISIPLTTGFAPAVGSSSKQTSKQALTGPLSSVSKSIQNTAERDPFSKLPSSESESESEGSGIEGSSRLSAMVRESLASGERETTVKMTGPHEEAIRKTITQMHNTCNLLNEMNGVGSVAMEHVAKRVNVLEGVIANMDLILTTQLTETREDYEKCRVYAKNKGLDEGERARAKAKYKGIKDAHDKLAEQRREVIQTLLDQYPATARRTTIHNEEARAVFAKQQSKTYFTAEEFYAG